MSFSLERIAFLFCDGKLCVQSADDHRACEEWAKTELGLTHSEWANSVRGYMLQGRVQFFSGEDYRADLSIVAEQVRRVQAIYKEVYGDECSSVFNGVSMGVSDVPCGPIYEYDEEHSAWRVT